MRKKRFYDKNEARSWMMGHVPATGMIFEGHDGTGPYWDVVW